MVTKRPNYLNFRRNFVSFGTIKHGAGTDLLFLVEHTKVDGMHNGTNDEGRGREGEKGLSYAGYVSHGGLINEADYQSALTRSRGAKVGDGARSQSEGIARFSGLDLGALRGEIDPRVLYGILRNDTAPSEVLHHHSQMSDQKLFVETLRMLEKGEAVSVVQKAYPNIFAQQN